MSDIKNKAIITYNGIDTESNEVVLKINGIMPTVIISLDKIEAREGETVTYTITVKNPSSTSPMNNVPFSDELDTRLQFVLGSFTVNSAVVTPTYTSNKLTYTLPVIAANSTTTIKFNAIVL